MILQSKNPLILWKNEELKRLKIILNNKSIEVRMASTQNVPAKR